MSTSDSTIKGKFNEVVGKMKQGVGEAVGSEKMANEGAAEEVKGHAQQAWGSVKEGAADMKAERQADAEARGQATTHDVREKITSTAQNVKDHIMAGVDDLTHRKAS